MHMHTHCDQDKQCGSRVISISLTDHGRRDSHSDYSADLRVVQCINAWPTYVLNYGILVLDTYVEILRLEKIFRHLFMQFISVYPFQ